jgi:hypothetical protein
MMTARWGRAMLLLSRYKSYQKPKFGQLRLLLNQDSEQFCNGRVLLGISNSLEMRLGRAPLTNFAST